MSLKTFTGVPERGDTLSSFLRKLPCSFAADDFRAVVDAVVQARKENRPVVLGMGAHPVKLGLSPLIIELMRRKIVTAIATNGACAIHDFEMAMAGHTAGVSGYLHAYSKWDYTKKAMDDWAQLLRTRLDEARGTKVEQPKDSVDIPQVEQGRVSYRVSRAGWGVRLRPWPRGPGAWTHPEQ